MQARAKHGTRTQSTKIAYSEPVIVERDPHESKAKAGIPRRYYKATWDYIRDTFELTKEVREAKQYSDNFESYKSNGVGLLLRGGVGTGKTTIAIAILQDYIAKGGKGLFIPMVSLVDNLFSMTNREERAAYETSIRKVPLLVIDDLGAEGAADWITAKIDSIITERYNEMKPTIITSNFTNEDLRKRYNNRTYDRIKATSKVIVIQGESKRRAV